MSLGAHHRPFIPKHSMHTTGISMRCFDARKIPFDISFNFRLNFISFTLSFEKCLDQLKYITCSHALVSRVGQNVTTHQHESNRNLFDSVLHVHRALDILCAGHQLSRVAVETSRNKKKTYTRTYTLTTNA